MTIQFLPPPPEPVLTPLDRWLERLGALLGAAVCIAVVLGFLWLIGAVR